MTTATAPLDDIRQQIRIVLIDTKHPGNIGAVARAMKNMGLVDLALVTPRAYPDPEASFRASNANDVLDAATVYPDMASAVADCGLVVGTSARDRRIPWPLLSPRELGERALGEIAHHRVAVVFGREDRGLTNDELHACHCHLHIPANPEYSSLNLAAAVQVVAYELRMAALTAAAGRAPTFDDWDQPPASHGDLSRFHEHLQETLLEMGFYAADNPKQTVTRLQRLFNRIRPDAMEISILRGVLTQVQQWVRKARAQEENDVKSDS